MKTYDIFLPLRRTCGEILVSAIPLMFKRYRLLSEVDQAHLSEIDDMLFYALDTIEVKG